MFPLDPRRVAAFLAAHRLVSALACVVVVLACAVAWDRARPAPAITFVAHGAFTPAGEFPSAGAGDVRGTRWGSWSNDNAKTGTLTSSEFRAPVALVLAVDGYPEHAGERVELGRADGTGRVQLALPPAHETWTYALVSVPRELRGSAVRLYLTDAAHGRGDWIGIGAVRPARFDELLLGKPILTRWGYVGFLYLALVVLAIWSVLRGTPLRPYVVHPVYLGACLAVAIVAYAVGWTNIDLSGWFATWGRNELVYGPYGVYHHAWASDNPPLNPGVMVVPAVLEALLRADGSSLDPFLFKLIPLASLFALPLVVRAALGAVGVAVGRRFFAVIVVLTVLNPAFAYDSAVWGQSDVYVGLLMLVAVAAFLRGEAFTGAATFVASVLTKPQPILALPALAGIVLRVGRRGQVAAGVIFALLLVLPTTFPHGGLLGGYRWLWELYTKASGEYAYGSIGAGTLPGVLVGDQLTVDTMPGPFGVPVRTLGNVLAALAGLTLLAVSLLEYKRLGGKLALWYVATSCMAIYWFAPHMHERYIAAAALFALVWALAVQTRTAIFAASALSLAMFLQMIVNWPLTIGSGPNIVEIVTRIASHHTYFVVYSVLNAAGLIALVSSRFEPLRVTVRAPVLE